MDHFTLSSGEAGWLPNKTGATRLGFAVQLTFLTWRGRFPRARPELPPDAVEHVAKQVGVAASEPAFYDFTSRAAKRHRSELRDLTGWHECTMTDLPARRARQVGGVEAVAGAVGVGVDRTGRGGEGAGGGVVQAAVGVVDRTGRSGGGLCESAARRGGAGVPDAAWAGAVSDPAARAVVATTTAANGLDADSGHPCGGSSTPLCTRGG
ncbi:DUF4158 domain-containing protein [Streptomyces sp. NPDC094038]|uniref:DUF4158 domain-containing protein n=1 Tax=Streptomyces sp. NPDC094038 TaxID=3366055 RepID=UPI00382D83D9